MRHPMLPNTRWPFSSICRMNTAPNIDGCLSMRTKAYRAAITSPLQRLHDPVNHPLIRMICPAMMDITYRLTMWLRWHHDEAIVLCAYWPPPGSIWIRHLKHERTGGKSIQITIITTSTQWSIAEHFGYRSSPIGCVNRRKHTQRTRISAMLRAPYSPSHPTVSEWRPVFPLAGLISAGGSQKPPARPFKKNWLQGSSLKPIPGFWQAQSQNSITRTQKTSRKWTKRRKKGNCTEWPRFTTFGDVAWQPEPTCFRDGI